MYVRYVIINISNFILFFRLVCADRMSLGLVAYGSSDESDNDDISPPGTDEVLLPNVLLRNDSKDSTNSSINLKLESTKTNKRSELTNLYIFEDDDDNENSTKDNVLLSLPAPKMKLHDLDVDVKKLKSSGTVRISIPSLSQVCYCFSFCFILA